MRTSIFPFFMKPKCVAGHLLAQRQIMRVQGSQSRAFCRRDTTRQRATRWQGADQSGQPGSMGFAAVVQFQPHWILARATVFSLFATLDIVISAFLPASSVMVLVGGSASKVTLSGSGVDAMVRVWRRGYASCQIWKGRARTSMLMQGRAHARARRRFCNHAGGQGSPAHSAESCGARPGVDFAGAHGWFTLLSLVCPARSRNRI